MKRKWDSIANITEDAYDLYNDIGESTAVEVAKAKNRTLGVVAKLCDVRLEHARRTKRLVEGSDVLPDVKLEKTS